MSTRYKCDINVNEDGDFVWSVTSRHNVVWTGTARLGDCERRINYTIKVDPANASSMPINARQKLIYKINRMIVKGIRTAIVAHSHHVKYGIGCVTM